MHGQLMACRLDITSQDWCSLQLSLIIFKYTWQFLAGICLPTRSLTNIQGGKEHPTHTHLHVCTSLCARPHACMQNTHTHTHYNDGRLIGLVTPCVGIAIQNMLLKERHKER